MTRRPAWRVLLAILLLVTPFGMSSARADPFDDLITEKMRQRQIVSVSLAVVQEGKIVKAKGYGFTDKSGKVAVTPQTLFQAGSISKPVAAAGALHLVEQKKLTLDADVNSKLRAWKVPANEFTKDQKVTLRGILSHSAGLTVHGFGGYAVSGRVPTLLQVLDGVKPANSAPIRVDIVPGSKMRYSGGGFTVMQQLMIDVTGQPFPKYMHDTILKPLDMADSTYEQPLPPKLAARTATGHTAEGKAVEGKWHVYPEMAAAGLWTTPSDLAKFAIGLQQTLAGKSTAVISQAAAAEMLKPQKDNVGLGLFLQGQDKQLTFFHGGRDEGFDALIVAQANAGNGAVVMINANDNSGFLKEVVEAIGKEYKW